MYVHDSRIFLGCVFMVECIYFKKSAKLIKLNKI